MMIHFTFFHTNSLAKAICCWILIATCKNWKQPSAWLICAIWKHQQTLDWECWNWLVFRFSLFCSIIRESIQQRNIRQRNNIGTVSFVLNQNKRWIVHISYLHDSSKISRFRVEMWCDRMAWVLLII